MNETTEQTKPQTVEELLADWHEAMWKSKPYNDRAMYDSGDAKTATARKKYTCLDTGTSGAFMLDNATGEVFCIKGYGKVDKRKRVGVLGDIDGEDLVRCRWWKLR